jgi:4-hydroxy-tetrahydrodipicolinate reductase
MLIVIIGISGRMGKKLYNKYKDKYDIIGVDLNPLDCVEVYNHIKDIDKKIDLVIDFSNPDAIDNIIYALKNNIPVISGTTGYEKDVIDELYETGKGLFTWSCNYAKGIPLFLRILKLCMDEYDVFDFVEIHASTKKDSPSGTAKMLADELNIPYDKIQSLRIDRAPAIHEIIYSSANERITIKHEVINPDAFIEGFDHTLDKMCSKEN